MYILGGKNVSFEENFADILNWWSLVQLLYKQLWKFGHLSNLTCKVIYVVLESKLEKNKQKKDPTHFA